MAACSRELKLVTISREVEIYPGDDVTIPCHLSPPTSVVAMEIRWFRGAACIYLYRKRQMRVRGGYGGRVENRSLKGGDVSLTLKRSRWADEDRYTCQVIHGEHKMEKALILQYHGETGVICADPGNITDRHRTRMEESVQALEEWSRQKRAEKKRQGQDKGQKGKKKKEKKHKEEREQWRKNTEDKTNLEERDRQLDERDRQLDERDRQLEERDRQLEERDRQLEERDRQLEEKCRELEKREHHTGGREWSGLASPAVTGLRLVLLGGSAAGKRAAGNTILGTEEFGRQASTHTLPHTSTESQHSESRQGEVAGRRLTVVETPDWFCSGLSEKDTRRDVGLCVRLSAPGPHAFLLVVQLEPSEGEERRILEKMEDIFGEGCWRHTLILFTHAEGLGQRSVEELLQTGSQELQQLVEKCGNRCHLLNIKDRPDDTEITHLLEKIEEMVSGNRETFYSSETYQEAERQLREIERRIDREQDR
ncbi:hypothetical protein ACEWY4_022640 [Coilia grayii]|uniref:Uncharacterized protein n=1 Tax=Coilia grayii TaxID=363190 RepID=A0ABD1J145_9TELE